MDQHLLETIKQTTEFIERHLLEDLCLDAISEHVNISKFHLLRIWKGATSTGLMEYVRRRRIALSLGDLLHQRNSLEFISSKYSFGCERSYSRVFKEEFKISPAKWRRNPIPLQILDRFNADFMSRSGDGLLFFRSITVLPSFTIAGLEYEVDVEENRLYQTANRLGVTFFYEHRHRILNPVERDVYYGHTTVPPFMEGFTFYMPSLRVNTGSIIPSDMGTKHILPHKYGVFTYMGPHRPEEISSLTLQGIWQFVHDTWKPTVEFQLEEQFHFERIDYSKCNKHYCECDLYFPISQV